MKAKRWLTGALASAMVLAMAVPAFAAGENQTEVTGETSVPTLSVSVPTTGKVTLNPYETEVTIGSDKFTDQIISAVGYVENKSVVAVNVSVAITGKVAGTAKLNATTTIPDPSNTKAKALTTNSVYMEYQATVVDANTDDPDWDELLKTDGKVQKIVVSTSAGKATQIATLKKGSGTAIGSAEGVLAYRLTGDAVSTPATAWTDKDTVGATIAYTFAPTVVAES